MSNDMKLIMESWRSYNQEQNLINENVFKGPVANVANELEAILQKAAEEQKQGDGEKDLQTEELASLLTLGWVAKFIFTKLLGAVVIGTVISRISTLFVEHYRKYKLSQQQFDPNDPQSAVINSDEHKANFLRGFTAFLEEAARTIGTAGVNIIGKKVVDKFVRDEQKRQNIKSIISGISTLIVFVITLGASGNELMQGVKESGTLKAYILELARASGGGLDKLSTMTAIGDMFELSADATEGTFKAGLFFKKIGAALVRSWPEIWQWLQQRM